MSEIVYNLGDSAVFCAFHDLHVPIPIQLPQRNSASATHICAADALFLCGSWASCISFCQCQCQFQFSI